MTRAGGITLVLALCWGVAPARAQPLEDGEFNIDLVTGPVLGTGRIIGLGGNQTALAAGIDGVPWNPAAFASRVPWELDWFSYDFTVGFLLPGFLGGNDDFDNDGRSGRYDGFTYWDAGLGFKLGSFGFGFLVRSQNYTVTVGDTVVAVEFQTANTGIAQAFMDGQLIIGLAGRGAYLYGISDAMIGPRGVPRGERLVEFAGAGLEVGGILRLEGQPWRAGLTVRDVVRSISTSDETEIGGFALPNEVRMPWEIQAGFAFQLGRRPFNTRWVEPPDWERQARHRLTLQRWERERLQVARELGTETASLGNDPYRWLPRRASDPSWRAAEAHIQEEEEENFDDRVDEEDMQDDLRLLAQPRDYWLITTEVLIVGPTENGVGIEAFLGQLSNTEVIPSGEKVTVQLRLGVETEPWHHRLKVRTGTYLEPSRFRGGTYRPHWTFGFDFRLFTWDLFGLLDPFDVRAGATIDLAPRYNDWGIGLGFWH